MDRFLLNHEVVSRIGRWCPLKFRDGISKTDNPHRRKSLRDFPKLLTRLFVPNRWPRQLRILKSRDELAELSVLTGIEMGIKRPTFSRCPIRMESWK
jgi:hypothetical protein